MSKFVPTPAPTLTPALLATLGFTAMVSPLASDMYLASFRSMQLDLNTTASAVQWSLTLFFFGIAVGQLALGALSDRVGRRRLMLTALAVFTLSGFAVAAAPTIELLIGFRLLQGFTGAAGIVIARAIAADLSEGADAVRALSLIAMGSGLGPIIAPLLGGFTHEWWGWRGTLIALACVSLVMTALAWIRIPESLPPERRTTGSIWAIFAPFGGLLRNPKFVLNMLAFVFSFAAMIAYIAASPFVGQEVAGMTPLQYAFGFSASGVALITMNLLNSRLAPKFGTTRMQSIGIVLLACGGLAFLLCTLTDAMGPAQLIVCAFVLTAGAGITMSNSSALTLAEAPEARGSGAALMGSLQFFAGGCVAPLVGAWGEHTALPMALTIIGAVVVCAVSALWAARLRTAGSHSI